MADNQMVRVLDAALIITAIAGMAAGQEQYDHDQQSFHDEPPPIVGTSIFSSE